MNADNYLTDWNFCHSVKAFFYELEFKEKIKPKCNYRLLGA